MIEKNLAEKSRVDVLMFFSRTAGNKSSCWKLDSFRRYFNVNEFSSGWWYTRPRGGKKIDEGNPTQEARKTRRFVAKKVAFRYAITRREFRTLRSTVEGIDPWFRAGDRASTDEKQRRRGEGRERQLSL